MPFVALVDGVRTISLDVPSGDWLLLKLNQKSKQKNRISCPYCDEKMEMVTNHWHTQFFRHKRSQDCLYGIGESPRHLDLKEQVYRACTRLYQTVDIEKRSGDSIIDVYVEAMNKRYAFEVQVSSITYENLVRRSEKYTARGIVPVWILKKYPVFDPGTLSFMINNHLEFWSYGRRVYLWVEHKIIAVILNPQDERGLYEVWTSTKTLCPLNTFCLNVLTGNHARRLEWTRKRLNERRDDLSQKSIVEEQRRIMALWPLQRGVHS